MRRRRQTRRQYPDERDGLLRVTKVENAHLTANQSDSGYGDLGTFEYAWDSASNVLTAAVRRLIGLSDEAGKG